MGFDWREFLGLARNLVGRSGPGYSAEASDRTAVSRAYYAAFCYVRDYAEAKLGFKRTNTLQDHLKLRGHLKQKGKVLIASQLERLRGWRNMCDYDDQVVNLDNLRKASISIADKIVNECPM